MTKIAPSFLQDYGVSVLADALGRDVLRFVGGCVRDAVMNHPSKDIDLAVAFPPDHVLTLLGRADIKAVPTGIDFGTITAIVKGIPYEITSLRRDIQTDGRHAVVTYTDDWCADAARRDFTINALYADLDGEIYDYHDGLADIQSRRLRFVGDPEKRIEEDALRILRFCRFLAVLDGFSPDTAALCAIEKYGRNIKHLSRERIGGEIKKLLAAKNPVPSWQLMERLGIVSAFLPFQTSLEGLTHLIFTENSFSLTSPICRLASLMPKNYGAEMAQSLALSNKERERLNDLSKLSIHLRGHLDRGTIKSVLYRHDPEMVREALFLVKGAALPLLRNALSIIDIWQQPTFPLRGIDLFDIGIPQGPLLGMILRTTEDWWIAEDFRPDLAACLDHAKKLKRD